MARRRNSFVGDWKRRRNVRCFVDRLVQYRAVEPDDMLDVVFDFGSIGLVQLGVVRSEVAVRNGAVMFGAWLVDVLGRQC